MSIPQRQCDGQGLKLAAETATAALERQAAMINSLNVFPVPDGDTGTNMLLTMRASLAEVRDEPNRGAGAVAARLAHGALMGARGNGGVILSQIIRGFASALSGCETFGAREIALGLQLGATAAYEAVSRPVEGTILTVARVMAEAATAAADTDDAAAVLEAAAVAAREAVVRTQNQLAILRETGVVDAGAQGLLVLLEGVLSFATGQTADFTPVGPISSAIEIDATPSINAERVILADYGYCTEFVIEAPDRIDPIALRAGIEALGDSTLVVVADRIARVHLHTADPGKALSYALGWGKLSHIKIDNMQEQHEHLVHQPPVTGQTTEDQIGRVAVVAVAPAPTVAEILRSLGAAAIVGEGRDSNPGAEDIVRAIEALPATEVLILPTNKYVLSVAQQAAGLTKRQAQVVASRNVAQAVAALVAFNAEAELDENVAEMTRAMNAIQVAEVTISERPGQVSGVAIKQGEAIGLINGQLVTVGQDTATVVLDLLMRMSAGASELVTIYAGEGVDQRTANDLLACVQQRFPTARVELIDGGQPDCLYLLSVE